MTNGIGSFQIGSSPIGQVVGIAASSALPGGALQASNDADYALLAANDARSLIGPVPGSGPIRGVTLYNGVVYAFRDNAAGTAGGMYEATPTGWRQVPFGQELPFAAYASAVAISIALPAVVNWNAHGLRAGTAVTFSTTGALPAGLEVGLAYYVLSPTANAFQLAASAGGAAIAVSGVQSGVQTCCMTGMQINAGDTITGAASGASGVVGAALLRTGTWTAAPQGTLVLATVGGTFLPGELLTIGGNGVQGAAAANTQIARLPGGMMEFCNTNFTGAVAALKMYGVDGVNPCFEFDGATYVPIHTGNAPDAPTHVLGYKFSLFLSFAGSVQFSGLGQPYSWTALTGGGEIGVGDAVTGFLIQSGTLQSGSALAIFTADHTFMMYGASSANFLLVPCIWDIGYSAGTLQLASNNTFGWTARGIQSLITTLTYGNFNYVSISHTIMPFINRKRGLECASTALKSSDQYRVYFSDGTALAVGMTGRDVSDMMPLNYGIPVLTICTDTLQGGLHNEQEATFFGSNTGYVYQDNIGTSFDGHPIEAWLRLPFNHSKAPRTRKKYRRAVFEGSAEGYAEVKVSYDLGYGTPEVRPSASDAATVITGGGGYWDQLAWDEFTWDVQAVMSPSIALEGTEKNISLLFYSNRAQDKPYVMQGLTLIYSPRRLER